MKLRSKRESELYLSLECSISARETVLVELTEDGARFDFQLCCMRHLLSNMFNLLDTQEGKEEQGIVE